MSSNIYDRAQWILTIWSVCEHSHELPALTTQTHPIQLCGHHNEIELL